MNKKTTKNKVKPAYKADITNCETVNDVKLAFALAKHNAKLSLTDDNLETIINAVLDEFMEQYPMVTVVNCECYCKKTPWYKRFWNWLTKPFKKNK